jgi:hypothetical protein
MTRGLKARTVEAEETADVRERLGTHASAVTDKHATRELLEAVFSMLSVPMLYTDNHG